MLMHASCAARDGLGIVLTGEPGSGKSDLLLRLLDRGFDLVADDQVAIGEDGMARPPETLAGLIEVRGLGIMRFPFVESARPVLVAQLAHRTPPRLPEPRRDPVLDLPAIAIDPRPANAAQLLTLAFDTVTGRARQQTGAFTGAFA
ncbi:HPr kinase/phosphorylase [Acidisoma cellulosilyticum]|nr:aldolase [Acidisoma cellulosilyticum]